MTREEIEGVGFEYDDCAEMMKVRWWWCCLNPLLVVVVVAVLSSRPVHHAWTQRYDKDVLVDGMNTMQGE